MATATERASSVKRQDGRAAVLASLVASAKQHGLDPYAYLRDVLTRIAATPVSQLDQFLPDRWQAAHLPATLLD